MANILKEETDCCDSRWRVVKLSAAKEFLPHISFDVPLYWFHNHVESGKGRPRSYQVRNPRFL
jgi:hypothetical protein